MHSLRYWPFVQGIHQSPVNSAHKGQWRGALMFSLICAWTIGWVNSRDASDLRCAHYDVIVIGLCMSCTTMAVRKNCATALVQLHGIPLAILRHIPCTLANLTHWGRVTYISISKPTIIGSDNGLSPDRRQAIIWTNAGLLLMGPLGTNFSEILIEILTFSFKKMHLKVLSAKRRTFVSASMC